MSHKFSITMREDSVAGLNRIRKEIETAGGIFQGDASKGTIAVKTPLGNIAGTYNIRGCLAQIEITDKPFLVSHLMIESKIKAYLT
ncbi:MAG: hypothetical protein WCH07_12085 [Deltaproteobacteria bacterium]